MSILHIQLLGDFRLRYGDVPLAGIAIPRLQSLLAYLLLHRAAPQARQQIAFLFWPDSSEGQAHTNLRKNLYLLRQSLPDAERFLEIENQAVQWRPDAPFTLDVAAFEESLAQAKQAELNGDSSARQAALTQAVELYATAGSPPHAGLLPGCYNDWIRPERQRLQQAFLQGAGELAGLLEAQKAYVQAISHVQTMLRHDPVHEASYQRLMQLYAMIGDRAGAVRSYHACVAALKLELDAEPSPATALLYAQALQAGTSASLVTFERNLARLGPRHNLPLLLTTFIGREREINEIKRLLSGGRLVTLTGAGGTGKSRLALQAATDMLGTLRDGRGWWNGPRCPTRLCCHKL
ncbi:MAG: hypothetical protein EXR62_12740 [Chloroflexi bacterium]|nr:hypothetical protein [Chloroflexota bacterium]